MREVHDDTGFDVSGSLNVLGIGLLNPDEHDTFAWCSCEEASPRQSVMAASRFCPDHGDRRPDPVVGEVGGSATGWPCLMALP